MALNKFALIMQMRGCNNISTGIYLSLSRRWASQVYCSCKIASCWSSLWGIFFIKMIFVRLHVLDKRVNCNVTVYSFYFRNMNWTGLIGLKLILKTTKSAWISLRRYFIDQSFYLIDLLIVYLDLIKLLSTVWYSTLLYNLW